jgi:hypothetical protein
MAQFPYQPLQTGRYLIVNQYTGDAIEYGGAAISPRYILLLSFCLCVCIPMSVTSVSLSHNGHSQQQKTNHHHSPPPDLKIHIARLKYGISSAQQSIRSALLRFGTRCQGRISWRRVVSLCHSSLSSFFSSSFSVCRICGVTVPPK